jgi:hypothetical protein
MIDFSKLSRPMSAAELEADDKRRAAQTIAHDMKRRQERSRRRVQLTITREVDTRHTFSGEQCLHIHGAQPDGKPANATWYAPDHFTRDQVDGVLEKLAVGVSLTLDGYWKPFTAREQTRFTFIAQFIGFADGERLP